MKLNDEEMIAVIKKNIESGYANTVTMNRIRNLIQWNDSLE